MNLQQAEDPSTKQLVREKNSFQVYVTKVELASGYTLVVSEGLLEPRSIGSVTVKLYRDLTLGDFVSAVSFSRDGTIFESVLVENATNKQQLSITTVTAGSGNYQTSQFICIQGEKMSLC
ncbi:PliI family lysozyme inhibitor of I-type lysozyme [Shewanella psychrophila]|uniref:PliI family lysozyme inhibitor of I-type lysozyme n=1 Tax=Shewanella psychrophila TaxID=225848 RepID=UPI001F1916F9|nr:PliI family lysozyme inhibitor of I-type lysozyme [Shewanella psychrophila]